MSPTLQRLLDALIALALEELSRKYPNLPVDTLARFARDIVILGVQWATDPVQQTAEIRAVYAKLESLINPGAQS